VPVTFQTAIATRQDLTDEWIAYWYRTGALMLFELRALALALGLFAIRPWIVGGGVQFLAGRPWATALVNVYGNSDPENALFYPISPAPKTITDYANR